MLDPRDQAEILWALAREVRALLEQTPLHQQVVAVPFAIEEGLHEAFEGYRGETGARAESQELGGLWKNRRPRAELEGLAASLEAEVAGLGVEPLAEHADAALGPPAPGHAPAEDICEEYPDVTSSLGKLVRLLSENPEIRRQGSSPLRLTVHEADFARFAATVRGAAGDE